SEKLAAIALRPVRTRGNCPVLSGVVIGRDARCRNLTREIEHGDQEEREGQPAKWQGSEEPSVEDGRGLESTEEKIERARCCRPRTGREQGAHELHPDDRSDGGQGILEKPVRQDARCNPFIGDSARNQRQEGRIAVREDRPGAFYSAEISVNSLIYI